MPCPILPRPAPPYPALPCLRLSQGPQSPRLLLQPVGASVLPSGDRDAHRQGSDPTPAPQEKLG